MFLKFFAYFQGTPILMNTKLVAAPASSEQKHVSGKHCIQQRHVYHLLKTPNCITLFISPDDYDITVNRKENANVLTFLMSLHFTEAATIICSLKKVLTVKKPLSFFDHFDI